MSENIQLSQVIRLECVRFSLERLSLRISSLWHREQFSATSSIGVNLVHISLWNILIHFSRGESFHHVECLCGDVSRSHVAGIPQGQVPQVLDCLHVADDLAVDQERLEHVLLSDTNHKKIHEIDNLINEPRPLFFLFIACSPQSSLICTPLFLPRSSCFQTLPLSQDGCKLCRSFRRRREPLMGAEADIALLIDV